MSLALSIRGSSNIFVLFIHSYVLQDGYEKVPVPFIKNKTGRNYYALRPVDISYYLTAV
jgi:hypothetical protein